MKVVHPENLDSDETKKYTEQAEGFFVVIL